MNKIDLIELTLKAIKMQYDNYKPIIHAKEDHPSGFWKQFASIIQIFSIVSQSQFWQFAVRAYDMIYALCP